MPASLREALTGDEAAIQDLVGSVLAEYAMVLNLEGHDDDLVDIFASYIRRGGCFLVVEDEGRITGCAGLYRISDDHAELRKMYLLPESRGRGWGRALLDTLLDEAQRRGVRRLTLESHSSLNAALGLYTNAGFIRIPHPHPSDRADVAMELVFQGRAAEVPQLPPARPAT